MNPESPQLRFSLSAVAEVGTRLPNEQQDGVLLENIGVLRHLLGESGPPEQMGYFFTTPRFRPAGPELQWLTRSVSVGHATPHPDNTVIDMFEVSA